MSDSVDRVFVHALNTVKRIPRTGTARPPAAERLKLYGLYKQSMEGDVEGVMDRPIGNTPEVHGECEKWYGNPVLALQMLDADRSLTSTVSRDAWYAQRDTSRTEAKRRYISTLIDTMHQYASQTPEARELVSELEFVWDQIKFNASSSSSSSPLNNVGVPPLSRSAYGSIGSRLAQSTEDYERPDRRANGSRRDRDSRLRVLSPVSQPEEEEYYRRRSMDDEDQDPNDDDDEEEEYEEARDSLYEDQDPEEPDHASTNTNTNTEAESSHRHRKQASAISIGSSLHRRDSQSQGDPANPRNSHWRRRVEQALTKMTAEIAAVREQMEARSVSHRRRSGLWAWVKWALWIAVRQIIWDLAMLGALLIWMRLRGDRRVEARLKTGWAALKARLGKLRVTRVDMPILP
ncbi:uncharacterized protein N7511_003453 [Penicillium nucicola]|uniref:uncharacterized protein n=1 Tax=Penicillium nucicola TaxID=1850975 RepID=UPI0025454982|nr:uncharacterized protein N7511_003453 [Penicillium nucicola]KAJ5771402.1 hypothetical protein N7511_003453 [Penicillium nucicola]